MVDPPAHADDETQPPGVAEELARQSRIVHAIGVSSPDFLYAFDRDHRFIYVNPPLLALWGKTSEEAVGRTFEELGYPPELVRLHRDQLTAAFNGSKVSGSNAYVNPRGTEGYYEYTFVPVFADNGVVTTVVGTTRDVTAKRQTERERQAAVASFVESEAQFRHFADAMPQLAWIARADGFIFWYNRRWYEYTGTTPIDMEGWGWQKVHDSQELPRVLERWKTSISSRQPFEMTFPLKGADGRFRAFLTRVNPVFDSAKEVIRWFGTNTDIEDERRTLQERDQALAAAAAAVRARDEFLAIASHELRTPLTTLLLQIEGARRLVERQGGSTTQVARLAKANSAGIRLNQLLSELLEVSRIDAGQLRLEPETSDLGALVQDICSRFEDVAQRRLRLKLGDGLTGSWDAIKIGQVVTNLVDNALKFGAGLPVEVEVRSEGKNAVISVADEGIGIAPERRETLFQRFSRGVDDRHFGGFGLGLWIVKRIVDACGGLIEVQGNGERGTVVVVRLPLRQ